MEPTYLKTFIEVIRTGNFETAAEKLSVSSSTVATRIRHMENQCGCSLLDRSGSTLKQTGKGQLLLEQALATAEVPPDVDPSNCEKTSKFTFVSTPTFGTAYLFQILSNFSSAQSQATNLNFSLGMPASIRESLRRGVFEIAVIEHCHDFDLSEFETVSLPDDDLVFATAASIKLSSEQPQIEELFDHALLSCSKNCCTRVILERNLRAKGLNVGHFKQIIECADLKVLTQALVAGVGTAFISTSLIGSVVERGKLNTYRIPDFIHQRKRSLVAPIDTMGDGLGKTFSNQIISYFQGEYIEK